MNIIVSNEIAQVCPTFVGACVEATVQNSGFSEALWQEINAMGEQLKATLTTETLKDRSGIAATRRVYRACGKDPSRYRPASEALIRRLLQGKELYQIDTLVDLINLASIAYGYSIGGFDADKFVGQTLTLGIGKEGEPYEGIGRGIINIAGLPVYRDEQGGVGTPTSDNERTKIDLNTTHLVVLINGYDGNEAQVQANAEFILSRLQRYCGGTNASYYLYK
ncbi:MAG TPA: phenylalanine--tRNA ligase beta subunit-related protein [Prevotella sp.]